MICKAFIQHLDGYLDGTLTELEMEAMQGHMQACPSCKKIYEEQNAILSTLNTLDENVYAPADLLSDAMQRIHKERNPAKRRMPWVLGGIAAAFVLIVGLSTLLGGGIRPMNDYSLSEMGTQKYATAGSADIEAPSGAPQPAPSYANYDDGVSMDIAGDTAMISEQSGNGASSNQMATPKSSTPEHGLKIIRQADINIETENYDQDLQSLKSLGESMNGFIAALQESGSGIDQDNSRNASLTIRIPVENLDAYVQQAKAIGSVINAGISQQDVTDQYVDVDRRLTAYQKQYDRILIMMDQTATIEELISIESELSRLEMLIEDCQGTLNYWDGRVNYSTVDIYVNEVRRAVATDAGLGERMRSELANSWDDFKEGCKDFVVNAYGSIPYIILWIVILAVAAVVIVIVIKTRKKRAALPKSTK